MKCLQEQSCATDCVILRSPALQAAHGPAGLVSQGPQVAQDTQPLHPKPFCRVLSRAQELYHQVLEKMDRKDGSIIKIDRKTAPDLGLKAGTYWEFKRCECTQVRIEGEALVPCLSPPEV